MPKIKTHKGAAKRFKFTAKGKIRRKRAYAGHLFISKSSKQKRRLRQATLVDPSNEKRLKTSDSSIEVNAQTREKRRNCGRK